MHHDQLVRAPARRLIVCCSVAFAALVYFSSNATTARADNLFTYTFAGQVDSVDQQMSPFFSKGDKITGSYTVDASVAARSGSNSQFAVYDALVSLNVKIGSYSASLTGGPTEEVQVDNNPPAPDVDRYSVLARASDGLTGPSLANGTLILNSFQFAAFDDTNTAFSDALIFPTDVSLGQFNRNIVLLNFDEITGDPGIVGSLTSLGPAGVPEPASLTLCGLGIVSLAGMAWRKRNAVA